MTIKDRRGAQTQRPAGLFSAAFAVGQYSAFTGKKNDMTGKRIRAVLSYGEIVSRTGLYQ